MISALLIVLREVFEAALIIGIVLAATRGVPGRGKWTGAGIGMGVAGALVVAALAEQIASALEGVGQDVFNAGVLLSASAMIAWHNVWMKSHGAAIAREMQTVGRNVASGTAPLTLLMTVVGLAVLREGSEVVLFLHGIAAGGAGASQLMLGGLLGLAGGVAIGLLMYAGLIQISTRYLFTVTNWLLLLLAAGMAAQAAGYLVQAGKLPALIDPVWDTSAWLPQHGVIGQVLHALIGYSERPSGVQLVFFAVVAISLALFMMRPARPAALGKTGPAAAFALVLGAALFAAAPDARAAHVVYSPIVEQGELALEVRGHHDFDGNDAADGAQKHKLEVEYAPTARWMTGVFGEWEKEPGGSLRSTEVAWENIFQLTEQGQYWMDVGLLAEYAHALESGGDDKLEFGLLGEKQLARSLLTANLVAERALVSGAETELEYAFRWRYRQGERFEPGIELHGELGDWGDFGSASDHRHQLGPAAYGKLRRADAGGAFKYEAAALFGLTGDSPDLTLRLLLEYEF
jgi:high-affinity iron transporter